MSSDIKRINSIDKTRGLVMVIVPWLGIMLTGFACGDFFDIPAEKRNKIFLRYL